MKHLKKYNESVKDDFEDAQLIKDLLLEVKDL